LVKGVGVVIDGKNNFIHNEDHFTAVVGLDNIVVISTDDATLIVNKDNVEDVRKAVKFLNDKDRQDLL
jgi:mannose-1-phosphate guanylyltransferase/mannose-6-phosphate isomerase